VPSFAVVLVVLMEFVGLAEAATLLDLQGRFLYCNY
jgi:hypothetical protein